MKQIDNKDRMILTVLVHNLKVVHRKTVNACLSVSKGEIRQFCHLISLSKGLQLGRKNGILFEMDLYYIIGKSLSDLN